MSCWICLNTEIDFWDSVSSPNSEASLAMSFSCRSMVHSSAVMRSPEILNGMRKTGMTGRPSMTACFLPLLMMPLMYCCDALSVRNEMSSNMTVSSEIFSSGGMAVSFPSASPSHSAFLFR